MVCYPYTFKFTFIFSITLKKDRKPKNIFFFLTFLVWNITSEKDIYDSELKLFYIWYKRNICWHKNSYKLRKFQILQITYINMFSFLNKYLSVHRMLRVLLLLFLLLQLLCHVFTSTQSQVYLSVKFWFFHVLFVYVNVCMYVCMYVLFSVILVLF